MKKLCSFLLSVSMTCALIPCFSSCGEKNNTNENDLGTIKNVIVVIGDGMGENHIWNAIDYFDLENPAFINDQIGYIGTNSLSGTTDSAAGGTALATGVKVPNGNVAQLSGEDLEQITSIAQAAGMKTGIITTDTLDGATPASFSAHANNRGAIAHITNTQATSGIDLMMGRYSSEYTNRSSLFTDQGYTILTDEADLEGAKDAEKLIGLFPHVNSEYILGSKDHFQLSQMTEFAIDYLENDNGFFLMIEGAYIDKYSHSNRLYEAMSETRSLFDTIDYLYEYAADGETAIFITADHETGGLQRNQNNAEPTNALYTCGDHTPVPVPLYVKNYPLHIANFGYDEDDTPENTIVFEACKSIITNK